MRRMGLGGDPLEGWKQVNEDQSKASIHLRPLAYAEMSKCNTIASFAFDYANAVIDNNVRDFEVVSYSADSP